VYDFLEREQLLNKTTIIIVADHGERGYFTKELRNYQLPFMVIRSDLSYQEIDGLYSHLDFKDILLSYMNDEPLPKPEDSIYIVGQTQSSEFAYVDSLGRSFTGTWASDLLKLGFVAKLSIDEIKTILSPFVAYKDYVTSESQEHTYSCELCSFNIDRVKKKNGE